MYPVYNLQCFISLFNFGSNFFFMYMYVYILFIIIGMFENRLICKQNHDTLNF